MGDKLAGAVLGSAWQPTQPVFTLLISILVGWEPLTAPKAHRPHVPHTPHTPRVPPAVLVLRYHLIRAQVIGISLSLAGALFMVIYGAELAHNGAGSMITGNVLFFFNCLATSLYVISAKVALRRGYPASSVTAWSYLVGALLITPVAAGCQLATLCPFRHAAAAQKVSTRLQSPLLPTQCALSACRLQLVVFPHRNRLSCRAACCSIPMWLPSDIL